MLLHHIITQVIIQPAIKLPTKPAKEEHHCVIIVAMYFLSQAFRVQGLGISARFGGYTAQTISDCQNTQFA